MDFYAKGSLGPWTPNHQPEGEKKRVGAGRSGFKRAGAVRKGEGCAAVGGCGCKQTGPAALDGCGCGKPQVCA